MKNKCIPNADDDRNTVLKAKCKPQNTIFVHVHQSSEERILAIKDDPQIQSWNERKMKGEIAKTKFDKYTCFFPIRLLK